MARTSVGAHSGAPTSAKSAVIVKNGRAKRNVHRPAGKPNTPTLDDALDQKLVALLERLKVAVDPLEVRELTNQLEQVVFHKQFSNA